MDNVRDLIQKRLKDRGLDMAEVSRALGRNHAWLQQFLGRGKRDSVPEDIRPELARILDVPESRLKASNPPPQSSGKINGSDTVSAYSKGTKMEVPMTSDEMELLNLYKNMDPAVRGSLIQVARGLGAITMETAPQHPLLKRPA